MHDGLTRKVESALPTPQHAFLEQNVATLTILAGPAAGAEFPLDAQRQVAGRSDAAQIRLEFASISAEHAAFELGEKGFGVRDLASTNGVRVNGQEVLSQWLEHGDRIQLGDLELQYVVEPRDRSPRTWELDEGTDAGA